VAYHVLSLHVPRGIVPCEDGLDLFFRDDKGSKAENQYGDEMSLGLRGLVLVLAGARRMWFRLRKSPGTSHGTVPPTTARVVRPGSHNHRHGWVRPVPQLPAFELVRPVPQLPARVGEDATTSTG